MQGAADGELDWWQTRYFAALLLVLTVAPLLMPQTPPLTDVPGHMGAYRVMLHPDSPLLRQWYAFDWKLVGYLGGEIFVSALGHILGVELATKILLITIPVVTVAGMLWISREVHGTIQPHVFFAIPFSYNIALQYGFINYTFAMALALNAFALWLRLGRLNKIRLRAVLFVPLSCFIWAAHLFGWLVFGLLVFCAEFVRQRKNGHQALPSLLRAAIGCLPLSLPFAVFLTWQPGGSGTGDYLSTVKYKPGWLAMALVDRWRAFDVASVMVAIGFLYYGLRSSSFSRAPTLGLAAAGLFVVFLAMPFGTAYVDARLLPYVIIVALLAIGASPDLPKQRRRLIANVGIAFVVIRILAGTISMEIEARDWDRRLGALAEIPQGARVAAFVTNKCRQSWRMERLNHLPSMAIVRRDAFTNDQFDLASTATLKILPRGIDGFAMDPSEMVTTSPCPEAGARTLGQALATVPRDRFDYIWLIEAGPLDTGTLRGLVPVWHSGSDWLFRIKRSAA